MDRRIFNEKQPREVFLLKRQQPREVFLLKRQQPREEALHLLAITEACSSYFDVLEEAEVLDLVLDTSIIELTYI